MTFGPWTYVQNDDDPYNGVLRHEDGRSFEYHASLRSGEWIAWTLNAVIDPSLITDEAPNNWAPCERIRPERWLPSSMSGSGRRFSVWGLCLTDSSQYGSITAPDADSAIALARELDEATRTITGVRPEWYPRCGWTPSFWLTQIPA